MRVHDPRWPDKVMVAALLVVMGGLLSLAFVGLRALDATIDLENAPLLTEWPSGIMLGAGLVAVVLGVLAYHHQAWVLVAVGIVANIVSLGFLGVSTVIGALALFPLVRAFMEGEEVRLDHRRVAAHLWPDKAIMASCLLIVGGAATLVHGLLLVAGRAEAPAGPSVAWGIGLVLVAAAVLVAARQAFHLRRAWAAWLGALLLLLGGAFYIVGPLLAVTTSLYLWRAEREAEFVNEPAPLGT